MAGTKAILTRCGYVASDETFYVWKSGSWALISLDLKHLKELGDGTIC